MNPPTLRDLRPDELPAAGAVAGRALADSPVFRDVYPSNPGKRHAALGELFAAWLKPCAAHGRVIGAFEEGTLAGVCALL